MEDTITTPATIRARVLRVQCDCLLVCDCCACRRIVVHAENACCFCPGDLVCIQYSGAMTKSIPPQITATCITKLCHG
jgi:hypothetical protein